VTEGMETVLPGQLVGWWPVWDVVAVMVALG